MSVVCELVEVGRHTLWMPDIQITIDHEEYILKPLKKYQDCFVVFNQDNKCIGWIEKKDILYEI